MSVTRHDIREAEFLLLYQKEFRKEKASELAELLPEDLGAIVNNEVVSTVDEVCSHIDELDEIIARYSQKRAIDRIPKVNLAVLRLAVFEINYRSDKIPMRAAINEAVDIVNKYAQETDVTFVNGVLGEYSRSIADEKK